MWSTFVVWCIYGVQCVVIGVTCGARSDMSVAPIVCIRLAGSLHI